MQKEEDATRAMVRRLAGTEKNDNTSESPIHSVFYHESCGEVFRGFGGGNQSGKKLNITPRSEGVHGVSATVAWQATVGNSAFRAAAALAGGQGSKGRGLSGARARYRDVRAVSLGPMGIQDK